MILQGTRGKGVDGSGALRPLRWAELHQPGHISSQIRHPGAAKHSVLLYGCLSFQWCVLVFLHLSPLRRVLPHCSESGSGGQRAPAADQKHVGRNSWGQHHSWDPKKQEDELPRQPQIPSPGTGAQSWVLQRSFWTGVPKKPHVSISLPETHVLKRVHEQEERNMKLCGL